MAYVNMTVDGQTKRTDKIIGKDASGNTKEMVLSAVVESSDQQGGASLEMREITDDASLGQYGGLEFTVDTTGVSLYSIRPKVKPTSSTRNFFHMTVYIDNDNSYYRAGVVGYTGAGYTTVSISDSTIVGNKCTILGTASLWLNKGLEYEVTKLPIASL